MQFSIIVAHCSPFHFALIHFFRVHFPLSSPQQPRTQSSELQLAPSNIRRLHFSYLGTFDKDASQTKTQQFKILAQFTMTLKDYITRSVHGKKKALTFRFYLHLFASQTATWTLLNTIRLRYSRSHEGYVKRKTGAARSDINTTENTISATSATTWAPLAQSPVTSSHRDRHLKHNP